MSNHLQWIEIENFKCFEKLKVDGLERVNLIGGDNNVGKTAFMEAVYINEEAKDFYLFLHSLKAVSIYFRNFLNKRCELYNSLDKNMYINLPLLFNDIEKELIIKNNFSTISVQFDNTLLNNEYVFKINDDKLKFDIKKINSIISDETVKAMPKHNSIKFLVTFGISNPRLVKIFSAIQHNRKKQFLNELINYFDNRIEEFDIIDNTPKCFLTPLNDWQDLSELGDGLKRFITIICAIWASKDGALFIDEIENGIHYTKLPKLWEIIFKTSIEANCQVFATTHSRETIEAFNKMQFELNEENTAYFEFMRSAKSGKIAVSKRDKDRLEYSLTHGGRFRGE